MPQGRQLSALEYVAYLRDSYPQTRYSLAQWDALYKRYECTVCGEAWTHMTAAAAVVGGSSSLRGLRVNQLVKTLKTGRYMACANARIDNICGDGGGGGGDEEGSVTANLHMCNFLPLVIGTDLDIRLRYGDTAVSKTSFVRFDLSHCGHVYIFGRFWVFNSFIHTDSRQCHRYRRHTAAADDATATVRMYVYDKTGKGNMLYLTHDGSLWLRDKFRREIVLISFSSTFSSDDDDNVMMMTTAKEENEDDNNDNNDDDNAASAAAATRADILRTFFRDLEPATEMSPSDFFSCCREYMKRGIADVAAASTATTTTNDHVTVVAADIPQLTREIDHINNKKVSNAASLYGALLEDLIRLLRNDVPSSLSVVAPPFNATTSSSDATMVAANVAAVGRCNDLPSQWKARVVQYAAMSHRANLLPFISRRTHIRRDWYEVMKRHMKNEMRNKRILTAAASVTKTCGGGGGGIEGSAGCVGNSGSFPLRSAVQSGAAAAAAANDGCNAKSSDGSGGVCHDGHDEKVIDYRYLAADVGANSAKMEQQFLCAKVHTDVEYDHELVKRMRVVNLNAMSCLKMPTGFTRFFSYFNVGNIGNAGRVMNRTHGMRDSFVVDVSAATSSVMRWLRSRMSAVVNADDKCAATAVIFAVNEVPVMCQRMRSLSFEHDVGDNNDDGFLNFWSIFLSIKYLVPGAVVTVVHLPPQSSPSQPESNFGYSGAAVAAAIASYFVNIRLTNGIPTCPVRVFVQEEDDIDYDDVAAATASMKEGEGERAAINCERCAEYYPVDGLFMKFQRRRRSSVRLRRDDDDENYVVVDSALPRCRRHIWCSRHELTLYESAIATKITPKLHEVACHGLLSVAAFPYATDASKLIVAINAHKRALEVRTVSRNGVSSRCDTDPSDASVMRRSLDACADRDWFDFDQNGKLTRFVFEQDNDGNDDDDDDDDAVTSRSSIGRLTPRNAIRLLFAFGDVDMLNCEDGYVLNERLGILADTTLCRKVGFSCTQPIAFRSRMTLEYTHDLGARFHVGTFRSANHIRFFNTSNSNVRVFSRRSPSFRTESAARWDERRREEDEGEKFQYDLYVLWNSSYLQRSFVECGVAEESGRDTFTASAVVDAENLAAGGAGGGDRTLLRERREYAAATGGPIGESSIELHAKYIRVILRATRTRQTIKLQNSFGQKGIVRYADLSDLVTDRGERVDLVSSMYSLLGRFACGQLLEQYSDCRYIFSKSTGLCVGTGGYGYFFASDDSAHNNFIYSVKHGGENPMRVCKITYESFLENGVSSGAFVKSSEFECGITNPYAGVPRNVSRALDCYGIYDRKIRLRSQTVLNERRRALDRLVVDAIKQRTSVQASRRASVAARRRKTKPRRRRASDNYHDDDDGGDDDDGKEKSEGTV